MIVIENKSRDNLSILDIGTGTGCIAISIKKQMNTALVSAFDVSENALKIANENAIKNESEVQFNKVDILNWRNQNVKNKYDVIVSNPPYITVKEKELMHRNVYSKILKIFRVFI